MACFHEALGYSTQRVMFDTVIGAKQIQQVRIADMLTGITQGQLLALQVGRLKDEGKATPQQVSLAKRANCHMACEVAREARRLLGANGILVEVFGHASHGQPRVGLHVRGDARHPFPHPGTGDDRAVRLLTLTPDLARRRLPARRDIARLASSTGRATDS